ncbi:MAG: hypothetical protein M0027_15325 [Candidatus Dormibacteraeota bacterium]|nr:hypothetical protein [Candidatus Dormibacteraeota bacterium]
MIILGQLHFLLHPAVKPGPAERRRSLGVEACCPLHQDLSSVFRLEQLRDPWSRRHPALRILQDRARPKDLAVTPSGHSPYSKRDAHHAHMIRVLAVRVRLGIPDEAVGAMFRQHHPFPLQHPDSSAHRGLVHQEAGLSLRSEAKATPGALPAIRPG